MAREGLLVFVAMLLVGVVGASSHDLAHIMERLEAAENELAVLRQHCATQASEPLVLAAPSITLATPEVNVPGEIRFGDNSTFSSGIIPGSVLGGGTVQYASLDYSDPHRAAWSLSAIGCAPSSGTSCSGNCTGDIYLTRYDCQDLLGLDTAPLYPSQYFQCCNSLPPGGCNLVCPSGSYRLMTSFIVSASDSYPVDPYFVFTDGPYGGDYATFVSTATYICISQ